MKKKISHNYYLPNTQFTSLKILRIILSILLLLFIVLYISEFYFQLRELIRFIQSVSTNSFPAIVFRSPILKFFGETFTFINILFVLTIPLYLIWLFLAYQNLYSLGFKTTRTPTTVVIENLAPGANIWGIYVGLRELGRKVSKLGTRICINMWWFLACVLILLKSSREFREYNALYTLSSLSGYLYDNDPYFNYRIEITIRHLSWSCIILSLSVVFLIMLVTIVNKISSAEQRSINMPIPKVLIDGNTITDNALATQESSRYVLYIESFLIVSLGILFFIGLIIVSNSS